MSSSTSRAVSVVACAAVLGLLTTSRGASAQSAPARDEARATALFEEAKNEIKRNNFAAACPKFVESHQLDPAGGTILHAADCHEHEGKLASALAEYTEALDLAIRDHRKDREEIARERIAFLEPKVGRIAIQVATAATEGLELTLDGKKLDSTQWAKPMASDRGSHVVLVTAPNRPPLRVEATVADGVTNIVDIPLLPSAPPPSTPTSWPASNPKKAIALGVGTVGVIGLAAGALFAVRSVSFGDQTAHCTAGPDGNACSAEASANQDRASTAGTISVVAFIFGAIAIGAGVTLWLTAPPSGTGVSVAGSM